jgi:hypothetical protein
MGAARPFLQPGKCGVAVRIATLYLSRGGPAQGRILHLTSCETALRSLLDGFDAKREQKPEHRYDDAAKANREERPTDGPPSKRVAR